MLKTSLNRIAVFGGDMRQVYLADILAEQGFEVRVYGLCKTCKNPRIQRASSIKAAMEYAETVAAPVPFSKGLSLITEEALLKTLKPGTCFFSGGMSRPRQHRHLKRKNSILFLVFLDFPHFFIHSGWQDTLF